ncbi:MAG: hypothetical protein MZV64_13275 [Ignavibacteriales bacterium]|nr:hypothetical protein [Ignavibacteriales bacterium]
MSALDTVPDAEFAAMVPGLRAMFAKKGWMKLLWGILFLPAGFAIQTVGLVAGRGACRAGSASSS